MVEIRLPLDSTAASKMPEQRTITILTREL